MRLAGVGEVGQKRLAAARVDVAADGYVGDVAVRYLAGAGCGYLRVKNPALAAVARAIDPAVRVAVDPTVAVQGPSALYPWRHRAASELATGAHLALRVLRDILEEPA
jgi:hypothetical protein